MEDLFETQLKMLVENASETKKKLEHRRAELDRQIGALEVELEAYRRTLESVSQAIGKTVFGPAGRRPGGPQRPDRC